MRKKSPDATADFLAIQAGAAIKKTFLFLVVAFEAGFAEETSEMFYISPLQDGEDVRISLFARR